MQLSLKDSAEYLGIEEKSLRSYAKISQEIPIYLKGRRLFFEKDDLIKWQELRNSRMIILSVDDYIKCLDFSFRIVYSGHTTSDFGTARQRGKIQAISNWTQGALAEVAIQKFIHQKFDIMVELDFSVHNYITGQDITQVIRNRVSNPPKIRASIKSGKLNSNYIVVPQNEVESANRVSDYYIFVRIDFPEDHLIRILKNHEIISNINVIIPDLTEITSYISGFIYKDELELVNKIPGQDFTGMRYVKKVGSLKNSDLDWNKFIEIL